MTKFAACGANFTQSIRLLQKRLRQKMMREKMFNRVLNWSKTFQCLSTKGRLGYDKVTPYMHCFLYHVPGFVRKYGNLSAYSDQQIEKLNDTVKFIHQKRSGKYNQTFDELMVKNEWKF